MKELPVSIFTSEDQSDLWIYNNLVLPDTGFYVDCGCAHPERYSMTNWLRAAGWEGLAIDGSYQYTPEWEGIRKVQFFNVVLSIQKEVHFLNEPMNTLVSRIHSEGLSTNATKLSTVLKNQGVTRIDFLSIDIEGHEKPVLQDIFNEGFRPEIIVAEFNSEHAGYDPALIQMIIQHGYDFVHMSLGNGVFVLQK